MKIQMRPGGRDRASFSAFSTSVTFRVYRNYKLATQAEHCVNSPPKGKQRETMYNLLTLEQRTLNLVAPPALVAFFTLTTLASALIAIIDTSKEYRKNYVSDNTKTT